MTTGAVSQQEQTAWGTGAIPTLAHISRATCCSHLWGAGSPTIEALVAELAADLPLGRQSCPFVDQRAMESV